MAYIKNENGAAKNLTVPGMDRAIDIPGSGVKQVRSEEVGPLVEHCPAISEHEPDTEED